MKLNLRLVVALGVFLGAGQALARPCQENEETKLLSQMKGYKENIEWGLAAHPVTLSKHIIDAAKVCDSPRLKTTAAQHLAAGLRLKDDAVVIEIARLVPPLCGSDAECAKVAIMSLKSGIDQSRRERTREMATLIETLVSMNHRPEVKKVAFDALVGCGFCRTSRDNIAKMKPAPVPAPTTEAAPAASAPTSGAQGPSGGNR